eukprot:351609-Chlamydomonas_euryale.AAC.11
MIQHCLAQPPVRSGDGPIGLVLAPTRELAQQIEKEVRTHAHAHACKRACTAHVTLAVLAHELCIHQQPRFVACAEHRPHARSPTSLLAPILLEGTRGSGSIPASRARHAAARSSQRMRPLKRPLSVFGRRALRMARRPY